MVRAVQRDRFRSIYATYCRQLLKITSTFSRFSDVIPFIHKINGVQPSDESTFSFRGALCIFSLTSITPVWRGTPSANVARCWTKFPVRSRCYYSAIVAIFCTLALQISQRNFLEPENSSQISGSERVESIRRPDSPSTPRQLSVMSQRHRPTIFGASLVRAGAECRIYPFVAFVLISHIFRLYVKSCLSSYNRAVFMCALLGF